MNVIRGLVPGVGMAALLAAASVVLALPAAAEPVVWRIDFDDAAPGVVSETNLAALSPGPVDWSVGFGDAAGDGRFRIVESPGHGHALQALYPRGGVGPRETGGEWVVRLPPRDTWQLDYRLRFSPDFDWVQGGKLPGLGGGVAPTGGFFNPDGFTSRYMWRAGGRLVVYLYWAGQPSAANERGRQYGVDLDCGVTLERGRDYLLRQRVTLNTPGKPDGVLEVWIDGEPVLRRDDLLFRDRPGKDWRIDRFFFSTFHGGNDPGWAPSHDCTVEFDDFVLSP